MRKNTKTRVVIIGAGQAGLAMSYLLKKEKMDHVVLEKKKLGSSWRNQRWDSFHLVTPNWQNQLPGFHYVGDRPDEFMSKNEIINYLELYQAKYSLPIFSNKEVLKVTRNGYQSFEVQTQNKIYHARAVVVATGSFYQPYVGEQSRDLPQTVLQLHSSKYRNARRLPPGSVLVVGSGQSGFQIASELNSSGRKVFLSVGSSYWIPRSYRGKDISYWMTQLGVTDLRKKVLGASSEKIFFSSPIISHRGGGAKRLSLDGVTLLGRFENCIGNRLNFSDNLESSFAESGMFFVHVTRLIDRFIEKQQLKAPESTAVADELLLSLKVPKLTEVDLLKQSISTVIWATGFKPNYSWIDLPVFDQAKTPIYHRGVTQVEGFYFLGLHRLYTLKSGSLFGVGEDAAFILKNIKSYFRVQKIIKTSNRMSCRKNSLVS